VSEKSNDRLTKNGKRKGRRPKYGDPLIFSGDVRPESSIAQDGTRERSQTVWQVRAIRGKNRRGYAKELQDRLKAEGEGFVAEESVKRRLARVRQEIHNGEGIDWLPGEGQNKPKK
jgi:hypothetical protein